MELKLLHRTVNNITVIDLSGRLVFGDESALLRETVKSLLPNVRAIVLNLKNVLYIDSGGLGTLVGLYSSAQAAGGEVKLCCLSQRTTQLLQVTKLVTVFEVFDTEESALASFGNAQSAKAS